MCGMKRFTRALVLVFLAAAPCSAQKLLQSRNSNCQAVLPASWAGTTNFSANPAEGKAAVSSLRGANTTDFTTVKQSLIEYYKPAKIVEDGEHRLWFEFTSAATPTTFDTHWLVVVPGKTQMCMLKLDFAKQAEPVARTIAMSLIAPR